MSSVNNTSNLDHFSDSEEDSVQNTMYNRMSGKRLPRNLPPMPTTDDELSLSPVSSILSSDEEQVTEQGSTEHDAYYNDPELYGLRRSHRQRTAANVKTKKNFFLLLCVIMIFSYIFFFPCRLMMKIRISPHKKSKKKRKKRPTQQQVNCLLKMLLMMIITMHQLNQKNKKLLTSINKPQLPILDAD